KITKWKTTGIMLSFAGMLVIFRHELTAVFSLNTLSSLYGALAEVASAAFTALAIVVYKRFYAEIDRLANLLVQTIIGCGFVLILGLGWERSSSLDFIGCWRRIRRLTFQRLHSLSPSWLSPWGGSC